MQQRDKLRTEKGESMVFLRLSVTHRRQLGISSILEADNLIPTLSLLKLFSLNVALRMKLGDPALKTGTLFQKLFAADI